MAAELRSPAMRRAMCVPSAVCAISQGTAETREDLSVKYRLEAVCCTDQGKIRSGNEDNYYFYGEIRQIDSGAARKCGNGAAGQLFAVFDGMGGEADGEAASWIAAGELCRMAKACGETERCPEAFFEKAVQGMNGAVCREAKKRHSGMGTTAVMLYLTDQAGILCNVGDSRAYHMREGKLSQISVDHTDAALLKEMKIPGRKPRLSQYIGIPEDEFLIEPHISKTEAMPDEQYLLCSDGLTDMVSEEEIAGLMREHWSVAECADRLMESALAHGGKDNVTFILIRRGLAGESTFHDKRGGAL